MESEIDQQSLRKDVTYDLSFHYCNNRVILCFSGVSFYYDPWHKSLGDQESLSIVQLISKSSGFGLYKV